MRLPKHIRALLPKRWQYRHLVERIAQQERAMDLEPLEPWPGERPVAYLNRRMNRVENVVAIKEAE